jgi:hypothetical protein
MLLFSPRSAGLAVGFASILLLANTAQSAPKTNSSRDLTKVAIVSGQRPDGRLYDTGRVSSGPARGHLRKGAGDPPCNIEGPSQVCLLTGIETLTSLGQNPVVTYTTTVSEPYTLQWSTTSSPADICLIMGPTDSTSVDVMFLALGVCTLRLTVTDPQNPEFPTVCELEIQVTEPPCSISGPSTVCAGGQGLVYTLSSEEGALFTTEITGNGTIVGNPSGPTVTVNAGEPGTFILTTTVNVDNCISICSDTVTVVPAPACTIEGPGSVCAGSTGNVFTVTSPGATFEWSIAEGNGSIVGSTTGSSVSVTAGAAGSFRLRVLASLGSCADTCFLDVTVAEAPAGCTIEGAATACASSTGNVFTITSDVPGATFSTAITGNGTIVGPTTGATITVEAGASGTFTLTTTVTANGCSSTCEKTVTVNPSGTCSIEGASEVCTGSAQNVYTITTDLAGATYMTVITGNGSIVGPATGSTVEIAAGATGSFTLTTTVTSGGCSAVCTKTVTVGAQITCEISGPAEVCSDSLYTFNVVSIPPGASLSWSISGNGNIPGGTTGESVVVDAGSPGTFTLTVTAVAGTCTTTCSTTRTVEDCAIEILECRLTGGGCLDDDGRGHKRHSFGGNAGESGEWEHHVREGNRILFNFHSHDAHVDVCGADEGPGPCSPRAAANHADFSGTGTYSMGSGTRDRSGTFTAHVRDRGEGSCGGDDWYAITVYDLQGTVVFHAEGDLSCGNLQIHEGQAGRANDNGPARANPPDEFEEALGHPTPNPFATHTTISYRVRGDEAQAVTIGIYDVSGRMIRQLEERLQEPGEYAAAWDGKDGNGLTVAGGMYFLRVTTGSVQAVRRLIFVP